MSDNTQLTSVHDYDVKRMIFAAPAAGIIPNSKPPVAYKRINISTKNEDGTVGELILPATTLFSFGVSENTDPATQTVNGYVLPICLHNRDGATPDEEQWVTTFNAIVDHIKKHLITHRDDIEMFELEMSDLKKLNPLYYKKDKNNKGKAVEGVGPTLYAKLIIQKKLNKVISQFYDETGAAIDAMSLIGKYCFVTPAVKIESIFVGSKISLQVKLYETKVKLVESGMKPLMKRPEGQSLVKSVSSSASSRPMLADDADIPDEIPNSDDESSSASSSSSNNKKKSPEKKVVKKVVKPAAKKEVVPEPEDDAPKEETPVKKVKKVVRKAKADEE